MAPSKACAWLFIPSLGHSIKTNMLNGMLARLRTSTSASRKLCKKSSGRRDKCDSISSPQI